MLLRLPPQYCRAPVEQRFGACARAVDTASGRVLGCDAVRGPGKKDVVCHCISPREWPGGRLPLASAAMRGPLEQVDQARAAMQSPSRACGNGSPSLQTAQASPRPATTGRPAAAPSARTSSMAASPTRAAAPPTTGRPCGTCHATTSGARAKPRSPATAAAQVRPLWGWRAGWTMRCGSRPCWLIGCGPLRLKWARGALCRRPEGGQQRHCQLQHGEQTAGSRARLLPRLPSTRRLGGRQRLDGQQRHLPARRLPPWSACCLDSLLPAPCAARSTAWATGQASATSTAPRPTTSRA
jgi:hypothetical protein